MAGMKTRFTRIKMFSLKYSQVRSSGILIVLLAFIVPANITAQEISKTSKPSQSLQSQKIASESPVGSALLPMGLITDIKVAPETEKTIVTLTTDRLLTPIEMRFDNPPRLVLDFPNTGTKVQLSELPVNSASIKKVRMGQHQSPDAKTRVVFDLDEGFKGYETALDRTSVRVVFRQGQPSTKASATPSPGEQPIAQPLKTPLTADSTKAAVKKAESKPNSALHPAPNAIVRTVASPAAPAADLQKVAAVKNEPPKPRPEIPASHVEQTTSQPVKSNPVLDAPKAAAITEPKMILVAQQAKTPPVVNLPKVVVKSEERNLPPEIRAAEEPLGASPSPGPVNNPDSSKPVARPAGSRFSGQPLTLDLINTSLVDFFRLMAEEGGVNIVLDPEVKGVITIKVVKLPWDQIFDAALLNNNLDKQMEGNLIRIARKSTLQNEAKQNEALKKANLLAADLETRIKRLNYAKATTLIKGLEEQKTVRGTVVVDERTNSLILTDIPTSLDKLNQLIDTLDAAQPQVQIEARIVSATRDFARDIGVQFGFVEGNLHRVTVGGPNTYGTIGGTRPSATPNSTYAAGTTTGRGAAEGKATGSGAVSTGGAGNYNVNLPATKAFGGLGVSIGNIFDTFLLDAAITAGESKGKAKLISQPKIVAQNNNPAVITQGLRFPVQTVSNNTVSIQFFNAALTLTATPQITYEGNILLDLKVENNSADFGNSVNNVPSIRTSESTTRVLISDGGTTIIGGIMVDEESTSSDKVPGLGSIPLLGNLFRRSAVMHSTQEVLFFVTPRIVK
jgi:type IV pilus secretin PilQ/predicted competence protein